MPVNLRRIARDLVAGGEEVRVLALTTVQRLSRGSVESVDHLRELREAVAKVQGDPNPDLVYLARQGLHHVDELLAQMGVEKPGAGAAAVPAAMTCPEVEAGLDAQTDPSELASLLAQARSLADAALLPRVQRFLKHPEPRVRSNAVEAVEVMVTGRQSIEILAPMLADGNHRVQSTAARALGRIGHEAVNDCLGTMVRSPRIPMREAAVFALAHLAGDASVDLLAGALSDPYLPIRLRAIRGLGNQRAARALPALQALLKDMEIDVCEEARKAIAVIQGHAPPAGVVVDLSAVMAQEPEGPPAAAATPPAASAPRPTVKDELAGLKAQIEEQSTLPRIDLAAASPQELSTHLKEVRAEAGRRVQKLLRAGTIQHPDLTRMFYDLLKYLDMLQRRQAAAEKEVTVSLFGVLKDKLLARPEDDPVKKLAQRVDATLDALGRRALELYRAGDVDFEGDLELSRREQAVVERLGPTGPVSRP